MFLVAAFFLVNLTTSAQNTRYIIKLKNKANTGFTISNPGQYLSARAIARRTKYNIAIDSTDLPVTKAYIDSIRLSGSVQILNVSKWLNQVAIRTTDNAALAKINSFPFVQSTTAIGAKNINGFTTADKFAAIEVPVTEAERALNYGFSNGQVKIHNLDWLHNRGFKGEAMHLAVLDGGFSNYQTLPTFDSVRQNGQILGTWDFVANEASVNEDNAHGMQCLSTIAANLPGQFVGTAPKASFYLYRTEDVNSEYPIEEQNWVAGIERADSLGVDITSTSLGYTTFDNPAFNHTYAQMDGNTTISAMGADIAARKGMLNVIAAGNEGTSSWHYISTPSDADSVVCVGAVDTLNNIASFSSYGPSSDGQIKPTVAAVGLRAIVASSSSGMPVYSNGTSFACPNMAGVTTCLWQAFPEVNNMRITDALKFAGNKFANPDDRVGYGVPDVKKAFQYLQKQLFNETVTNNNCTVTFNITAKTTDDIKLIIERKLPGQLNYEAVDSVQGTAGFAVRNYVINNNVTGGIGIVQYRTAMRVGNDMFFYLDSSTVNITSPCSAAAEEIFVGPNPVVNNLTVSVQRINAGPITLILTNSRGQKMYSKTVNQPAGLLQHIIPMSNMARGVYVFQIYDANKSIYQTKIVR